MSDCIEWQGYRKPTGYGSVKHLGKVERVHRVAYCKYHNLSIDDIKGQHILHRCDNPPCVNPEHLFIGTHKDNMNDMDLKNRRVISRGEQQGQSKLTEEIVKEIRVRYKYHCRINGSSALSREFGVSHSTILRVLSRDSWAHVESVELYKEGSGTCAP